jgi:hypothetical protein
MEIRNPINSADMNSQLHSVNSDANNSTETPPPPIIEPHSSFLGKNPYDQQLLHFTSITTTMHSSPQLSPNLR